MLRSIREGKSFVSNFSSEHSFVHLFVITSPPQNTSNRGRVISLPIFIITIIAEKGVCQKPPQTPPNTKHQTPRAKENVACVICFFFLTCPKTLNAFFYLFAFRERNFLAQKTTRKEGFVWSSGQNVIFTTTTPLNYRKEYDYFYSFRRFNESMRSVVLVLVVV